VGTATNRLSLPTNVRRHSRHSRSIAGSTRKLPPVQGPLFMEDPPQISEPLISIFVSYFEYVVGHNFTCIMSKGKKKMEIYGSDIRGGSSVKGGP
jgi:hypothetical protein